MTAQTLITGALKLIGALAQGETPPAADVQDGLVILNGLMDAWRAERLTILNTTRNVYTLTAGTQTYTLGPTGSGATLICTSQTRPIWLQNASIIPAGTDPAVEIPIDLWTDQDWATQRVKSVQSSIPTAVYYNEDFPTGSLSFWPVPNVACQAVLYWPQALVEFATLTGEYALAPGYEDAIKYNLAVRLAPEFGRPLDPTVAALAVNALAIVKRANKTLYDMRCDPAILQAATRGTYNWLIDT